MSQESGCLRGAPLRSEQAIPQDSRLEPDVWSSNQRNRPKPKIHSRPRLKAEGPAQPAILWSTEVQGSKEKVRTCVEPETWNLSRTRNLELSMEL